MKNDKCIERDPLTEKIISACYQVHSALGPGFAERIYSQALKITLEKLNFNLHKEKEYKILYDKEIVGKFRIDLVIENKVIVELKAIAGIVPKVFEAQVISYLKASGLKVGLLVNFGNKRCEIRRLMLP